MNKQKIIFRIEENYNLIKNLREDKYVNKILEISNLIIETYKNGNKVLIAGNGGSAADAQHIAAELVNIFYEKRRALSAISLSTDVSVLTSWSNDVGYESVFERQIEAHGKEGDIFLAISTSGNSKNLIKATKKANEIGIITIALLGKTGGELKDICKHSMIVPHQDTARIQEAHHIIYHIICEAVEEAFLK